MGNQQDAARTELHLVRRKMQRIATEISAMLSVREFDNLPFVNKKEVIVQQIIKCERRIAEIQKNSPKFTEFSPYHRDFKKMKEGLEKVQFRPDITDEKVLDRLYPPPELEPMIDTTDLFKDEFGEDEDGDDKLSEKSVHEIIEEGEKKLEENLKLKDEKNENDIESRKKEVGKKKEKKNDGEEGKIKKEEKEDDVTWI